MCYYPSLYFFKGLPQPKGHRRISGLSEYQDITSQRFNVAVPSKKKRALFLT